jgi:hypothetical protein
VDAYHDFLRRKQLVDTPSGIDVPRGQLHSRLFEFQKDLVQWALRRGRAAIFADCGLGKTLVQLEWARQVHRETVGDVLILAPLAVAQQTALEAETIGLGVTVCRTAADVSHGINIANYERLHLFDPARFAAVVLDESSILKSFAGATCQALIQAFRATPFRLCCTATPAPNDHTELANHSDFLGIKRRQEMLTTWFLHDSGKTQDWRLKGHAEGAFWTWMSSWAAFVRKPSDLGYDDGAFTLPPLETHTHLVEAGARGVGPGALFETEALTLTDRRAARKASLGARVEQAAALVAAEPDESWILWCDLNDESDALAKTIPHAMEVRGSHTLEQKEEALIGFTVGGIRRLVTKSTICGFGLNWQHCARVCFVGISDSYEQRYQAIRRCWRFGQTRPVHIHDILGEHETAVLRNLERKHKEAERLAQGMQAHARPLDLGTTAATRERTGYDPREALRLPSWLTSGVQAFRRSGVQADERPSATEQSPPERLNA